MPRALLDFTDRSRCTALAVIQMQRVTRCHEIMERGAKYLLRQALKKGPL